MAQTLLDHESDTAQAVWASALGLLIGAVKVLTLPPAERNANVAGPRNGARPSRLRSRAQGRPFSLLDVNYTARIPDAWNGLHRLALKRVYPPRWKSRK